MIAKFRRIPQLKALKDISTYFTANVIKAVLPFIALPILTMYLTPADYGIWSLYLALISLMMPLTACGLPMTIGRKFPQVDREEHAKMEYSALVFIALLCGLLFRMIAGYCTIER